MSDISTRYGWNIIWRCWDMLGALRKATCKTVTPQCCVQDPPSSLSDDHFCAQVMELVPQFFGF